MSGKATEVAYGKGAGDMAGGVQDLHGVPKSTIDGLSRFSFIL